MCKYELSQEEWTAVMSSNPSYFRGVNVHLESAKWDEIQNLISRLNEMTGHKYRLPTEAEWEFAARGGNLSCDYRYSGSNNPDEVAWYAADSLEQMQPVGKKKPNELGLYDMSGNAFEWCNDWYGPYGEEHQIDPKGPERGTYHVLRGGSWKQSSNGLRVSFRTHIPTTHLNKCGFRLAEEVEKETVITTVSNKDNGIKQFYNLQGLLLAKKPQKGTYICKEWDREKQNWVIRKITAK